ncbi:MAG: glycosyltransferase [Opitutaceae bacterium]|nr:glycosyltransferase [Opitutaceae bacterium]
MSIVIPSFNHARYVGEAVESALAQVGVTVELIVVDDGSHDGSPRIVTQVFDRRGCSGCELIVQDNQGAHAAINRGLERARGEFLHILNSDDRLHPGRCSRLIAALGQHGQLAISDVRVIDAEGRVAPTGHPMSAWYQAAMRVFLAQPSIGFGLLAINSAVTTSNFLFRRDLLDKTGGFTPEKLCHDWRFLLRALRFTEPVRVPEPLLDYRFHGGNTAPRVMTLRRSEGETALREYLSAVCSDAPVNRLAPSPFWWPGYFDVFVRSRRSWFANQFISEFLPPLPNAAL